MTKQESMAPDQKEQEQSAPKAQPQQEQVPKSEKRENLTPEELREMYRRLEKTRSVLHTAGDIEVGQTPCEVLHETRTYRLLHYQQMVSKTVKTPILVVYALINKSYVLDLQPDKSWIKSLLSQGFQ